ncbi:MAG: IS66 family transposase [Nanoarchaeota archaeon]|nr:IS66 family transposase [Nanoarchaeota archaeon]
MDTRIKLSEQSKDELIDIILEKEKKIKELEQELKKYKNPNTPSSANKHLKPDTLGLKAKLGAKRGAPVGHRGDTIHLPPAEEIIPVPAQECSHCGSNNIEPTGDVKEKHVLSLIKPRTIVKKYLQEEMRCFDCHKITVAAHKDIPERGIYDKTIQSLVNYLKFKARLPHNLVVDCMNTIFGVPMTPATSLEITRRASKKLEPSYHQLEEQIKQQKVVNADETSHSVNGVNHWVWVFCNSLLSLFKFNKERGGTIVEETLGKDFQGILGSDGWRTYTKYSKENHVRLQRCFAHAEREIEFECKVKHPELYQWFCDIYALAKKGRMYKQEKKRYDLFEKCKAELSMWITYAEVHRNLRKLAGKIKNGGDDWFTGVIYPEVPLDNNEAERSLRPFVVIRKIIGCLRSDIGKRNYEVMMSLISTWQKQGKNTFCMLEATL